MQEVDIKKIQDRNLGIKESDAQKENCIKNLIEKYGQIYPLITDHYYNLIDGHIQFKLMKELGIKIVSIKMIETLRPEQLYLELNFTKHSIHAIEAIKYLKVMRNQQKADNNTNHCLPFTEKRIDDLIKMLTYDYKKHREEKSASHDLWDESDEEEKS